MAGSAEPDPKWPAQGACLANLMEMYNHILMPDIHYFVGFFKFFFPDLSVGTQRKELKLHPGEQRWSFV